MVVSGETKKISELPQATNLVAEDLLIVERAVGGTQKMNYGTMVEQVGSDVVKSQAFKDIQREVQQASQNVENLGTDVTNMGNEVQTMNETVIEFDERVQTLETGAQTMNQDIAGKLAKPEDPDELTEGYVYQDNQGNVILKEGGGPGVPGGGKAFKYTITYDNGADGTPTNVQYMDDCTGFSPASGANLGSWGETRLLKEYFRPCVLAPGAPVPSYYLNPNNLRQKEDLSSAVLTGADGDVMVEVSKLYGKFTKNGNRVTASISNVKEDSTWFCWNNIAGVEKEKIYKGRYNMGTASGAGTVARSISGVAKTVNITRATGRTYARNRGTGYEQNPVFLTFLWEFMYLLMYKNRNSQDALGKGRSNSSNTGATNTGWSDNYGCCFGNQDGVTGVVFLWCEDWYGDLWEWIDGLCLNNKVYKLTRDPSKYDDTGNNYEISVPSGFTAASNSDKDIKAMVSTNDIPFLPSETGASGTTFFCDHFWMADGVQVASFGGAWHSAADVGAFCWALYHSASHAYSSFGSRLCKV